MPGPLHFSRWPLAVYLQPSAFSLQYLFEHLFVEHLYDTKTLRQNEDTLEHMFHLRRFWPTLQEGVLGACGPAPGLSEGLIERRVPMTNREDDLTPRQRQILDVVRSNIAECGYPPSVREIGARVGLASPSTVKHHLDTLEKLGVLERAAGRPRAIRAPQERSRQVKASGDVVAPIEIPVSHAEGPSAQFPLVGRIAAGAPVTAEQHVEDVFTLPTRLTGTGELFVLEVTGDSMIDAAICDGDYVVVRSQPTADNGTIVAAMIEGEATVKVFSRTDGHVWLLPRNESYAPIPGDDAVILGRVVTVVRAL